jgi:hypothetical protein
MGLTGIRGHSNEPLYNFRCIKYHDWIVSIFSPIIAQMIVNPYLFVIGLAVITVLLDSSSYLNWHISAFSWPFCCLS